LERAEVVLTRLGLTKLGSINVKGFECLLCLDENGEEVVVDYYAGKSFVNLLFGGNEKGIKNGGWIGIPALSCLLEKKEFFGLKTTNHLVRDGLLARSLKVAFCCLETGSRGMVIGVFPPYFKGTKKGVKVKELTSHLKEAGEVVKEVLPPEVSFSYDRYGKVTLEGETYRFLTISLKPSVESVLVS